MDAINVKKNRKGPTPRGGRKAMHGLTEAEAAILREFFARRGVEESR